MLPGITLPPLTRDMVVTPGERSWTPNNGGMGANTGYRGRLRGDLGWPGRTIEPLNPFWLGPNPPYRFVVPFFNELTATVRGGGGGGGINNVNQRGGPGDDSIFGDYLLAAGGVGGGGIHQVAGHGPAFGGDTNTTGGAGNDGGSLGGAGGLAVRTWRNNNGLAADEVILIQVGAGGAVGAAGSAGGAGSVVVAWS